MALVAYKSWAVDDTGAVIANADIEIRERDGSTATTIYSDASGTAQENPFAAASDGSFSFWAPSGEYDVRVGPSGAPAIKPVTLVDPAGLDFEPRADLVTFIGTASFDALDDGAVMWAGGFGYVKNTGARVIPDMNDVEPFGSPVSAVQFGATGDGATDDTASLQAAADFGGRGVVPAGTYMMTPPVQFSAWVGWEFEKGATIKWREAPTSDAATFEFRDGSDGSYLKGPGVLDGDRDSLAWPTEEPTLTGVRCYGVGGVKVSDLTIKNMHLHGVYHGSGDNPVYRDLIIMDCGRGLGLQFCENPTVENIYEFGIGNNGLGLYQHANIWRNFTGGVFSNINIIDYQPDAVGLEPNPHAIGIERSSGFTLRDLYISGFSGSSPTSLWMGVLIDGSTAFSVSGLAVIGYVTGLRLSSVSQFSISNFTLDGQFVDETAGGGIEFDNGGLYPNDFGGAISQNTRAIAISDTGSLSNGTVTGYYTGVDGAVNNVTFTAVHVIGAVGDGWNFREDLVAADFDPDNTRAVIASQRPTNVELIGCSGRNSGRAGFHGTAFANVTINGGDWRNNGQDSSFSAAERSSILLNGGASAREGFRIFGADCRDTQSWTVADLASFTPGPTDANNEMSVVLLDPTYCEIGQYITLKNAIGSDVTGKVVYKYLDDIRVRFTSAQTFTDTGNLNALTGTVSGSAGDTEITGLGSAFDTEVKGHVYLEIGGEYHRAAVVSSATSLTLTTPLVGDHTGVTANLVQIDVDGIPSQQRAIYANTDTSEPVSFHNIRQEGNLTEENEVRGVSYGDVSDSTYPVTSGTYSAYVSDNSGNESPTTVTGNYTRAGNRCRVVFSDMVNIDTTGMTSGDFLRISLPFAKTSTVDVQGIVSVSGMASVNGSGSYMFPVIIGVVDYARLLVVNYTGSESLQKVSNLSSGVTDINQFSIEYEVEWT